MPNYAIGCEARLSATFKNSAGALADPTTVTLKVKPPKGAVSTITSGFDHAGTGLYHYDLALTMAGTWHFRWIGSGAVTAAEEAFFTVRASQFG